MCGIVAIVAKDSRGLFAYDRDVFEDMLVADSVRGMDSTGVFGVSLKNEMHIVKQAIDPLTFMNTTSYKTWGSQIPNCRVVVGHNRKATSGDIVSKNAHPFREGNIVLVHNGMLFNSKNIHAEAEVDSHALCHSFSTKGAKETLEEVSGAFALIWYDLKERELYLWRNSERPLSMVETNDRVYIASEFGMLKWILNREKRGHSSVLREGIIGENTLFAIKLQPFKLTSKSLVKKPFEYPTREANSGFVPAEMAGDLPDDPNVSDYPSGWLTDLESKVQDLKAVNEGPAPAVPAIVSQMQLRSKYPFDSQVLFSFEGSTLWRESPKGWEITGQIFLPGCPPVNGFIYTHPSTTLSLVKKWKDSKKIIGSVDKVLGLKDGSLAIHLDNKKIIVPETVMTFNKTTLPFWEWEMVCKSEKCRKCTKPLDVSQAAASSVNEKQGKLGVYTVVCHKCLAEALPKATAALLKGPVDLEAVKQAVQGTKEIPNAPK